MITPTTPNGVKLNEGVKHEQVEESHSAEWLADLASFGFQEVDTNKASNVEATERPSIESTRAMLEQQIKATDNELPNFEEEADDHSIVLATIDLQEVEAAERALEKGRSDAINLEQGQLKRFVKRATQRENHASAGLGKFITAHDKQRTRTYFKEMKSLKIQDKRQKDNLTAVRSVLGSILEGYKKESKELFGQIKEGGLLTNNNSARHIPECK